MGQFLLVDSKKLDGFEGLHQAVHGSHVDVMQLGPYTGTFLAGFGATAFLMMLWPGIDPGLATFWDRTLGYQAGRDSPFSIWGQVHGLEPLRVALLVAVAALSIALAFRPRRKSLVQVAALGAALIIALQLTATHWFYLYVVWFYPLLLVALTMVEVGTDAEAATTPRREPVSEPARSSQPVHSG